MRDLVEFLQELIRSGVRLVLAAVTFLVVVGAFLAFDDITTGNETNFHTEYSFLRAGATWCLIVAVSLIGMRHFALGGACVFVLAAAVWGQRSVGPGTIPSWQPGYVATVAALGWFVVLSLWLFVSALGRWDRSDACSRTVTCDRMLGHDPPNHSSERCGFGVLSRR